MTLIYKILREAEWREAQTVGVFRGSAADLADGFIHFSTAMQARATAAKHFAGERDLTLAAVEAGRLGGDLRWEPSRGGGAVPASLRGAAPRHDPLDATAASGR